MTTIIIKNSSTSSAVPVSGDLTKGELAVNVTDKKLYTKDNGGSVVKLVGGLGNQEASAVAITGGAIDGTPIGATTASTASFTTLSASGNVTLSGGTANGVLYLNGSKVATSGSALTWNTNLFSATGSNGGYSLQLDTTTTPVVIKSNDNTGSSFLPIAFSLGNGGSYLEQMRLTSTGLGIGTSSPSYKLDVSASGYSARFYGDASNYLRVYCGSTYQVLESNGTNQFGYVNGAFFVQTAGAERARIDSSGRLLVGTTSSSPGSGAAGTIIANGDGGIFITVNTAPIIRGYSLNGGFPDLFQVANNGNVTNANNSYGAISDVKLKENIVDASPKLADMMQVRIRNYNLIGDTTKQIGVVAQELETVFPGMIDETPDRDAEGNDLGTTTKSVKYSVFVPMLIKAIQELKAEFDAYKASHP